MNNLPTDNGRQTKDPLKTWGFKEKEKEQEAKESFLEEREKLPELAPELKEIGVESLPEEGELPEEMQDLGVPPTGMATPVFTQPIGKGKLPLTEDQIQKALHQKIIDSVLWLAYWCLRQIKIAHLKVKRYGSKS